MMSRSFDDAFESLDNISSKKRNEKDVISSTIDDLKKEADDIKMRAKNRRKQAEKKRLHKRNEYLNHVQQQQYYLLIKLKRE